MLSTIYFGGVGGETKTTICKAGEPGFPYTDTQRKIESEIFIYFEWLGSWPVLHIVAFTALKDSGPLLTRAG